MALRLDLGSGPGHTEGWTRVDFDEGVEPDILADVAELPLEDSTVDEICASHILEHLPWYSTALEEWHRVLKSGGLITIIVPDPIAVYYVYQMGTIDRANFNSCFFGAHMLGLPHWSEKSHTHVQVFMFDMLVQDMLKFFPDAHRVVEYGGRICGIGETMAQGHKP